MGASRLFGYRSGTALTGTSQSGNLAVSNTSLAGGTVSWFNGPDEDLGYVIGYPDTSGLRKSNGNTFSGAVGFVRTTRFTDSDFLNLTKSVSGQSFSTPTVAREWLNTNGYYTSYSSTKTWTWYRWQITDSKTYPPVANCVQASEFSFSLDGVDRTLTGCTVTNPGGNNPIGETPGNLIDGSLSVKALDLNFVTNGNTTNFIFQFPGLTAFNGYRWSTANDEESRDPKSWTISGSLDGSNWTTLHTVTGFVATSTRNTWAYTSSF